MYSRSLRVTVTKGAVKSVLTPLSNASVVNASLRFQSTISAEPNVTLTDSNKESKSKLTSTSTSTSTYRNKSNSLNKDAFAKKRLNYFVNNLHSIASEEFIEFSPYFEKIKQTFEKASPKDKATAYNSMISIGNRLLTKILTIKSENNIQVSTSILFKEVITLLVDNNFLHSSHLIRYIRTLIEEQKYVSALTFWIENANYFKHSENAFKSTTTKPEQLKKEYKLYGLSLYLLSLIQNNEKSVDPEFIKLIFGENKPVSYPSFEIFLKNLSLPEHDLSIILKSYSEFSNSNFDINSQESLKGIRIASLDGKIVYLENTINNNLETYKGKESKIEPDTIAHYMKYLNNAKLYSRSIEMWKFACTHKIPLNISIWNQLLNSFSNMSISNSENKVESVWKLLNDSVKPNSESYSIYLKYLLKSGESERVKVLLTDLKTKNKKLFDSNLKNTMIEYLLISNKNVEAYQLFLVYKKEESYIPNIEIYNKLLSKLVQTGKVEEANNLLDDLLSSKDKNIQPDIATWTTIIDLLMKNVAKSDLSKDEVLGKIFEIINIMKGHNIQLNAVALTVVATNLLKNHSTNELGLSILQGMENSGLKLNLVGYTGIITSFANNGDTDNALYYYNKALKNGILPTAFLYNSILKGYSKNIDISKTKIFIADIKALIKANPNNLRLLPNKYTFYFLLSQGIQAKNREFVNEILTDLGKSSTDLGNELPKILKSLQENGYTIPSTLESQIQ
jgi:pentatricopeptide repeat protein